MYRMIWAVCLLFAAIAFGDTVPGDLLVSGYYCDGIYRVNSNGQNLGLLTKDHLSGRTHSIVFSPDGQYFYVDHYEGTGSAQKLVIGQYITKDGSYVGDAVPSSIFAGLQSGGGLGIDSNGTFYISGNLNGSTRDGAVRSYTPGASSPILIDTLKDPWGLVLSKDGKRMFVTSWSVNTVFEYKKVNGTWQKQSNTISTTAPEGLCLSPDQSKLYISKSYIQGGAEQKSVQEYDISGQAPQLLRTFSGGGLSQARYCTIGPDGNLYVTNYQINNVIRFDITTGIGSVFASGLPNAMGLAFVPIPDSTPINLPKIKLSAQVGHSRAFLRWNTTDGSPFNVNIKFKIAYRKLNDSWTIKDNIEGMPICKWRAIIEIERFTTYEMRVIACDNNTGKEISSWSNTLQLRNGFANQDTPRPYAPVVLVPGMGSKLDNNNFEDLRAEFSELGWLVSDEASVTYDHYGADSNPEAIEWYNNNEPENHNEISVFTFVPYSPNADDAVKHEVGIRQRGKELGFFLKKLVTEKPFQLVGHSLGGLTCRAYLQDPSVYNGDVTRLVTVSTPNNGVCPDVSYKDGKPESVAGFEDLMINKYCSDPRRNLFFGSEVRARASIGTMLWLLSLQNWDYLGETMFGKTDVFANSVFMDDLRDLETGVFRGFSPDITLVSVVNKTETYYYYSYLGIDLIGLPFHLYNLFMGYAGEGGGDGLIGINSQDLKKVLPDNNKIHVIDRYKYKDLNHVAAAQDFIGIMMSLDYPVLQIKAKCPIDLEVTSPSGQIISKDFTSIFLAEYSEEPEENDPNDLSDLVEIPLPEIGNYAIKVIPDPNAEPDDTYSLIVTRGDVTTILAENVKISDIPQAPYQVTGNTQPVANAGSDISIHCNSSGNATVQLDGSGSSDADNDTLTYHWSWMIDIQTYSAEGVSPTVSLPLGTHEITLVVNDGVADSQPDTVVVTVYNTVPVANAGITQTVYAWMDSMADVNLDGSGSSDPDGDAITYKWSWTFDGNTYEANGVNPVIELPVGQHVITLVVNDGLADSLPAEVVITVVSPVDANLNIMPRVLNCKSFQPKIMAMLRLPKGITKDQIDTTQPLLLYPGQIESDWKIICGDFDRKCKTWNTIILASFDKEDLMDTISGTGPVELAVVGQLKTGQYFYGTDTITVINPGKWHRPWNRPWYDHDWN